MGSTGRDVTTLQRTARRGVLAVGMALAFDLAVGYSPTSLRARDIEILGDPRPGRAERIDLGRPFGTAPCVSRRPGQKTLAMLLSGADRILIHQFDARRWRDLEAVKTYIRRLLSAEPEVGMLSPGVYWAEARQGEILASVDFSNGRRWALHLANGYAHAQDSSGCEWWARYLGPDRTKWVVWPKTAS